MPYVMRYSRLFSLGNFENEKIELERTFPDKEIQEVREKAELAKKMYMPMPF